MTLRGKEYKARFISILTVEEVVLLTSRMEELKPKLLDPEAKAEYKKVWLEICALMFEGDVSSLSRDVISSEEEQEIVSFFGQSVRSGVPKLNDGDKTSTDSSKEGNPAD